MVYLPPPYEETLTKITRAASLSSSKDAESIKIEDLEAKLCPELKSSGRYVWRGGEALQTKTLKTPIFGVFITLLSLNDILFNYQPTQRLSGSISLF